jgi:antirestriction protein ArdC
MDPVNLSPSGKSSSHRSVYQIVTEQVLRQLESGIAPWRKPWRTDVPMSLGCLKPYRGLNVLLLASQGYASRYWLTFNQAAKLGGHVKKGEHGTIVSFWKIGEYEKKDTGEKRDSFLLRYYRVFNLEQTEGIADKLGEKIVGFSCPASLVPRQGRSQSLRKKSLLLHRSNFSSEPQMGQKQ